MRAVRALVSGVAVVAFVALGGSAGVSAQPLAACTGGWEAVQTPTPPNVSSGLSAVSAASSTDAWAIGFKETFIPPPPHAFGFLLHWDGASWTEVPDADPTAPLTLAGVVDIAPGDAWAVGFTPDFGIPQQPRVEHWDGVRWTVVATPSLADAELNAVTAISSTDVWAVGSQFDDQRNQSTLTEHWDGSAWSIVPSPNQQSNPTFLTAVAARASNDVFAAGGVFSGPDGEHGFVIRWNGTAWSTVRVPLLS
ncbi:MAG TPA: hypothetical protein VI159_07900, partial [Gemmatimonadales bacterium]